MKTKLGIVLMLIGGMLCIGAHSLYAQTVWSELNVANVLSLQFPPTLELRDLDNTAMKALNNGIKQYAVSKGISMVDYRVVLQPKGFNTYDSSLYARVIVSITVDTSITGTELIGLTDSDIKEADDMLKEEYQNQGMFKATWYGTTYTKYDGKYALVSRYDRTGLNGDVHVDNLLFFLKNYTVEITISYRKTEAEHWERDLNKIPSTLKFK